MKKPFAPNFKTPLEDYCKEEINKGESNGLRGNLATDFKDSGRPDIAWESEQIAKSHGIYLEFNRAKTGKEKDWMYMIRLSVPGGGPINRDQWLALDSLSDKYTKNPEGHPSLRLTTRQNIQFHWVKKEHLLDLIRTCAENDLRSLNGCGDNTRNVMGTPLSYHSPIFNGVEWAHKIGEYFQLPVEPFIKIFAIDPKYVRKPEASFAYGPRLLNRKFKIAFGGIMRDPVTNKLMPDNSTEILTNDVGIAPILTGNTVTSFQIYIGGGQGERNAKPSLAALAQPFAQVNAEQLLPVLDAIAHVHQEWGDRQNRFWARLKYVVKKMGIEWYREQVKQRVDFPLTDPNPDLDYGNRQLYSGWHRQEDNGLWTYGAFIENGRISDAGPNGRLKTMVRDTVKKYPTELFITPNQDLLFTNIPEDARQTFEANLQTYGYGRRHDKPYSLLRLHSGACVGRDTCRLTYTDSEKFEPELLDELEGLGWGELKESIGITGCERQCFRPATKTIGLVGSGLNRYQLKLFGDETGRFQGKPLISSDGENMYLRSIPRDQVAGVLDILFRFYREKSRDGENLGTFLRRTGAETIIALFKENPLTASLMEKPFNTACVIE